MQEIFPLVYKKESFPVALIALGLFFLAFPFIIPGTNADDTETPTLSVSVQSALTLTVPVTSIGLPDLTPGTAVATTSTSTIATNNSTGFNFSLQRDDADTTLDLSTDASVNITDKLEWIPGVSTSTAGNAAAYTGTGLAFRMRTYGTGSCAQAPDWWGSDGSPLYAGIASSTAASKKVTDCNYYVSGNTDVVLGYTLDVPTTQRTGSYTGGVTYTAAVNP